MAEQAALRSVRNSKHAPAIRGFAGLLGRYGETGEWSVALRGFRVGANLSLAACEFLKKKAVLQASYAAGLAQLVTATNKQHDDLRRMGLEACDPTMMTALFASVLVGVVVIHGPLSVLTCGNILCLVCVVFSAPRCS